MVGGFFHQKCQEIRFLAISINCKRYTKRYRQYHWVKFNSVGRAFKKVNGGWPTFATTVIAGLASALRIATPNVKETPPGFQTNRNHTTTVTTQNHAPEPKTMHPSPRTVRPLLCEVFTREEGYPASCTSHSHAASLPPYTTSATVQIQRLPLAQFPMILKQNQFTGISLSTFKSYSFHNGSKRPA